MWKIEWIDKSGKRQSQIVPSKTKAELILDNLENAGIDRDTFTISTL